MRFRLLELAVLALALWLALDAVRALRAAEAGVSVQAVTLGGAPATLFRPEPPRADGLAPVVVIAHGFAGSSRLMRSFALSLARAGAIAVAYDALGHGRNRAPLTGDVTKEAGATQALMAELARVTEAARRLDGADPSRVGYLAHSMSGDIVIRQAQRDGGVGATVAVSAYARTLEAAGPKNLLMLVGGWEQGLAARARAAAEADPTRAARTTPNVEHVGVLFAERSMVESVAWLIGRLGAADGAAPLEAVRAQAEAAAVVRGPATAQLLLGIALLGWPLSRLLPRGARPERGGAREGLRGALRGDLRGLGAELSAPARLAALLIPAVATPLLLWRAPIGFLPVAVADYLAAHFLVYGLLTTGVLALAGAFRQTDPAPEGRRDPGAFVLATLAYLLFLAGFLAALHWSFTNLIPTPERLAVIAAVGVGAAAFFLADAWATRGPDAPFWAAPLSKVAFLGSLAAATALDLERLFFLIVIAVLAVGFFLLFGLFSRWTRDATGDPAVGAVGAAVAFAWCLGATFPILG